MEKTVKVTLKKSLEKRLEEHMCLAEKGLSNTRNEALAFWYGYSMAINEVKKIINV